MEIHHFFDPRTFTLTYVVFDPATRDAVLIDPVLDFDPLASRISTKSAVGVSAFLRDHALALRYVLETHAHADHLSASQFFKHRFGADVAIGARITEVQATFKQIFDLPPDFATDGRQFDRLLQDGETLQAGSLAIEILATPGHTPACVSYKIGDALFTGDALFIEDYGTGRCDFPNGSAADLYRSVHDRLYALPDATRVFVGHDYQPDGRPLRYETTIAAERERNVQLRASTAADDFIRFRTDRDAGLAPPRLLYPSVQVNVDAGRLPAPRANGRRYLTIPLFAERAEEWERESAARATDAELRWR
jgi:glyoxylase-like metal-dependent hydrolase (beta-lactamase superfamily II)